MTVMKQYTIYRDADMPLEIRFSVREVLIGAGTVEVGDLIVDHVSLQEARDAVPQEADHVIGRRAKDDSTIVETWI